MLKLVMPHGGDSSRGCPTLAKKPVEEPPNQSQIGLNFIRCFIPPCEPHPNRAHVGEEGPCEIGMIIIAKRSSERLFSAGTSVAYSPYSM